MVNYSINRLMRAGPVQRRENRYAIVATEKWGLTRAGVELLSELLLRSSLNFPGGELFSRGHMRFLYRATSVRSSETRREARVGEWVLQRKRRTRQAVGKKEPCQARARSLLKKSSAPGKKSPRRPSCVSTGRILIPRRLIPT